MVKKITEAEFTENVKEGISVVDFSAEWCGPCRLLSPVLEKISEEFGNEIKFFNVDVDEAQDLAGQLGIMSIPAVYIFKDGKAVGSSIGFKPEDDLKAFINVNK